MASRQYENFKNPVLQTRADRNQLNNQRMNTYSNEQQLFARDPWFAFGRTIGQALADNYNDRGIAKGTDEMKGVFNSLGQPQQPQQFQQPATVQPDMSNAITMPGGEGNEILTQPMANPNATLRDIMAQEKRDYKASLYANSDNPTSEGIQTKKDLQALDQAGNSVDFGQLNKEDVREQVREQLQANGRTPYQIEQVLGQFDRMYDSKEAKWKEAKGTDFLQKGINAMSGDNPDMQNAMANLAAAAEYGNKQAGFWLKEAQYRRARADRLSDMIQAAQIRNAYGSSPRGKRGGPATAIGTLSGAANVGEDAIVGASKGVSWDEYKFAKGKVADGKGNDYDKEIVRRYEEDSNHGARSGVRLNNETDTRNVFKGLRSSFLNDKGMTYNQVLRTIKKAGYDKMANAQAIAAEYGIDLDDIQRLEERELQKEYDNQ